MSTTEAETLLLKLVGEIDFVTSGGDDPHDTCGECRLAGVGMLRDARKDAVAYLRRAGVIGANAPPVTGCPVCDGHTDARRLLLDPRCQKHLKDVVPLTQAELEAALAAGVRDFAMARGGVR